MEIIFRPRPIIKSPIAILEHLYFYTTQYGLSVKQFTGAHWKYWEKLPHLLRKVNNDPEELESLIQQLENLAKDSEKRRENRRKQIYGNKWQEKEIILNAQLMSVLEALPGKLLSLLFQNLIDRKILPDELGVVDLEIPNENFIEPDLLISGNEHLLMVEVKTRGGSTSSRSYPAGQLLNYIRLVAECEDHYCKGLPTTFSHLLLMPTADTKWIEQSEQWVDSFDLKTGRISINPRACIKAASRKKLTKTEERISALINETPIFMRSWYDVAIGFDKAVNEYNDKKNLKHWLKIGEELKYLSEIAGRYSKKE